MDLKKWEENYRLSPVGAEMVESDFAKYVGTDTLQREWRTRALEWIDATEAWCLCAEEMSRMLDRRTGLFGVTAWKDGDRSEWSRLLERYLEKQRLWSGRAAELVGLDGLLLSAMERYGELCGLCQRLDSPALWTAAEAVYGEWSALRSRMTDGLERTVMPVSQQMDRLTRTLEDSAALSEGKACSVSPLRESCGFACNFARERVNEWKRAFFD